MTSIIQNEFARRFGRNPDAVGSAHGRVNLIGEHTDYNGGFVLPIAIPHQTHCAVALRADREVHVATLADMDPTNASFVVGKEERRGDWVDYAQGISREIVRQSKIRQGFDLLISSEVPVGSGLASSAALGIALLRALGQAFNIAAENIWAAHTVQRSENEFVGAHVGIMDPLAAALASTNQALFIDTRNLGLEHVTLPSTVAIGVVDSGIRHRNAAGDYNTRRRECERAGSLLGVAQLRDVAMSALTATQCLPPPLSRRVRHVVTENQRVLEAIEALKAGDVARLGRLFIESHVSMRDDYEVSAPEVDVLVAAATATNHVFGARLTGGGFGGSIVFLAEPGMVHLAADEIVARYAAATGLVATVHVPRPTMSR